MNLPLMLCVVMRSKKKIIFAYTVRELKYIQYNGSIFGIMQRNKLKVL